MILQCTERKGVAVLQYLIENNIGLDENSKESQLQKELSIATRRGRIGLVKCLLDKGAKITKDVFLRAVRSNNCELLRYLVEQGSNEFLLDDVIGESLIQICKSRSVSTTETKLIKYLLDLGINANFENDVKIAIMYAEESGLIEVVELLKSV